MKHIHLTKLASKCIILLHTKNMELSIKIEKPSKGTCFSHASQVFNEKYKLKVFRVLLCKLKIFQ